MCFGALEVDIFCWNDFPHVGPTTHDMFHRRAHNVVHSNITWFCERIPACITHRETLHTCAYSFVCCPATWLINDFPQVKGFTAMCVFHEHCENWKHARLSIFWTIYMDVFVHFQITWYYNLFPTRAPSERFHTCVRSFVHFELTWYYERFPTRTTTERFHTCVRWVVHNEGTGTCERLSTFRTCKRLHICMRSFVYFSITWFNKWFSTKKTRERFLSRVRSFVNNEGIGTPVRLSTVQTCIRFHTSVHCFVRF